MNFKNIIPGLIALLLFGCGTDELTTTKLFVKEIEDPTCYKDIFDYENNHLIQFKRYFGTSEQTTSEFTYQDNKLTQVVINNQQGRQQIIEVTYGLNGFRSADKITTFQDGEIKGVANRAFDYNDGLLKSIRYVSNDPNSKPTEVEFQWTKNNITRIDFYYFENNERFYNGNRTFIYDDKPNYSNQDIAFTYLFGIGDEVITSRNNLIMSQEDTGNNVYKSGQYSFSYNNFGYPINYTYSVDGRAFTPIQIKYQ